MSDEPSIDSSFDMRSDAEGKDPDSRSKTLRRYHQLLWSKNLPGGARFDLSTEASGVYLLHESSLGRFLLSSDTVIRTFRRTRRMSHIINQISEAEQEAFSRLGYSIGGMMIFPGRRVNGKWTINQARGMNSKIEDRFDLTLECIRRHYLGEISPLSEVLDRYSSFFALFGNFKGYSEFFLLQDLVSPNFTSIRFFADFDDFVSSPFPQSLEAYAAYRSSTIDFVKARNARIDEYSTQNLA